MGAGPSPAIGGTSRLRARLEGGALALGLRNSSCLRDSRV